MVKVSGPAGAGWVLKKGGFGLYSSCSEGVVEQVLDHRPGATEVLVAIGGETAKALNYDLLTGPVIPGDRVCLNTTAVSLGLGTGGYHLILVNLAHINQNHSPGGHAIKLRYTPQQVKVLAVEEKDSPYREQLLQANSLQGVPVIAGLLHSMLPVVAMAIKLVAPGLRVVYLMTDGGALPLAFSKLVPRLRQAGLLDGTITAGNSFGGELEAVNIYSGLLAAVAVLRADVIITAMGPGMLGTGTRWGFSGVEQGQVVNAAYSLSGLPVIIPRISFADLRVRHQGISHHTLTILEQVVLVSARVALPAMTGARMAVVLRQLRHKGLHRRYRLAVADGWPAVEALQQHGIEPATMGRSAIEDREFFSAAAAAGMVAAGLAGKPGAG